MQPRKPMRYLPRASGPWSREGIDGLIADRLGAPYRRQSIFFNTARELLYRHISAVLAGRLESFLGTSDIESTQ